MYFTPAEFAARRAIERAEQERKQQEKEEQARHRQEEHQRVITDLFEQLSDAFRSMADEYNAATPVDADRLVLQPECRTISQNKLVPADLDGWWATLHDQGLLVTREKDRLLLQFYTQKEQQIIGGQLHTLLPIVEGQQVTEVIKLEGTNGLLLLRSNDKSELIKQATALCLFKLVNLADDKLLGLNESLNITPENIRLQLRAPALK